MYACYKVYKTVRAISCLPYQFLSNCNLTIIVGQLHHVECPQKASNIVLPCHRAFSLVFR